MFLAMTNGGHKRGRNKTKYEFEVIYDSRFIPQSLSESSEHLSEEYRFRRKIITQNFVPILFTNESVPRDYCGVRIFSLFFQL